MRKVRHLSTLQKWSFYYVEQNKHIQVALIDCRVPSRTKYWKKLKSLFNSSTNKNVTEIGYEIVK